MSKARSFAPLARPDARVLILGSMPGQESLRRRQYYAYRHNLFWPIIGELFGVSPELDYDARVAALTARGVAVWDVLKSCEREGSLDGNIRPETERPNNFSRFLAQHPRIRAIFFNGGKAASAFARHVLPQLGPRAKNLHLERLPSTSPAHAGMPRAAKLRAWRAIRSWL
jgi:TDG/mug DNA glycosylase family protein